MNRNQLIITQYHKEYKLYVKRIRPIFLKVLQKQVDDVTNYIEQFGSSTVPLDLILQPEVFRKPMVDAYNVIGLTGARREYYNQKNFENKDINLLMDTWSVILREYALNYAYIIENELNDVSKEQIRLALERGYADGSTGEQMITLIRKSVRNEISRFRATLIARTETTTAINLAKENGAKSYFDEEGLDGYQQWLGVDDIRERHTHRALNNTVLPMGELWNVGGQEAAMPGDVRLSGKERIQCRCTRSFFTAETYRRLRERGLAV